MSEIISFESYHTNITHSKPIVSVVHLSFCFSITATSFLVNKGEYTTWIIKLVGNYRDEQSS